MPYQTLSPHIYEYQKYIENILHNTLEKNSLTMLFLYLYIYVMYNYNFIIMKNVLFFIHSDRNNDIIGIVRTRARLFSFKRVTRKDYLDADLELIIN